MLRLAANREIRKMKERIRNEWESELKEKINEILDERARRRRPEDWGWEETICNIKDALAEIKRLKRDNANLRAKIESLYLATRDEEKAQNG